MFDYAVLYELAPKNYARDFNIAENNDNAERESHIPFEPNELALLWANCGKIREVDTILINCYSGWRPGELCALEIRNIDLKKRTMFGGGKTDAGIDRYVPIHSRILELVTQKYNYAVSIGSPYLISSVSNRNGKASIMTYNKYNRNFHEVINRLHLNPEHKPHDCRKTFTTMAKNAEMDEYAIKYIVGHEINDITERIYTKREFSWLAAEIEKIK